MIVYQRILLIHGSIDFTGSIRNVIFFTASFVCVREKTCALDKRSIE